MDISWLDKILFILLPNRHDLPAQPNSSNENCCSNTNRYVIEINGYIHSVCIARLQLTTEIQFQN